MCVLGIEPESSGRAVSALNCSAISTARFFFFRVLSLLLIMCVGVCLHAWCSQKLDKDVRFLGTGVIDSCEIGLELGSPGKAASDLNH